MTPSRTAWPPTSVSSPLSRMGSSWTCAKRRRKVRMVKYPEPLILRNYHYTRRTGHLRPTYFGGSAFGGSILGSSALPSSTKVSSLGRAVGPPPKGFGGGGGAPWSPSPASAVGS